MGYLRN